jgi:hypothetical protein
MITSFRPVAIVMFSNSDSTPDRRLPVSGVDQTPY